MISIWWTSSGGRSSTGWFCGAAVPPGVPPLLAVAGPGYGKGFAGNSHVFAPAGMSVNISRVQIAHEAVHRRQHLVALVDDQVGALGDQPQTHLGGQLDPAVDLAIAAFDQPELLPPASKALIDAFLAVRKLPEPVTADFASAVQEALSGLEKIIVTSGELRQTLLAGGSPATPEELRKRFDMLISERGKGKDASKLRFVIE